MTTMTTKGRLSVNEGAAALVEEMRRRASELRIEISKGAAGETLIDSGRLLLPIR